MDIDAIFIARDIEEKLREKHRVSREEVEQVFEANPRFHFAEKGHIHGEDLYRAVGRTENGRYLVVFFVHKQDRSALVISARDLTAKERKRYAKK
jgi:uncharacterized DUF497 family protein